MRNFRIKDLIKASSGKLLSGNVNNIIKNISIDSRTIAEGELFFAIKGANFDGHNFISEAIDKGASAIVVEEISDIPKNIDVIKVADTLQALGNTARAYRSSFKNIKIIAITGSNGKTTVKEMLRSILNVKDKTIANKGNLNNRIGLPLSLFELDDTYKYGVFEIGTSLFGEIDVLSSILLPNAAAITNIGYSHLETFISPAGVFKEKKNIFNHINKKGFIALNNDDVFVSNLPSVECNKIITFSMEKDADVYSDNISINESGMSFKLHHNMASIEIAMSQKGRFFIKNALCAATIAIGFGLSLENIKKGLESFEMPKMRMETFFSKSGALFINDAYNANPSSMREAIRTICETYPQKEITLVLGDMLELGDKTDLYHKEMGSFIDKFNIKSVYLTGSKMSNAKDELKNKSVYYFNNSTALAKELKKAKLNSNSVVLLKASRGMKLEKVLEKQI